jgi:diguanylate cyclase (GGDEF)-like protein/PAS domain S-box-containing protein
MALDVYPTWYCLPLAVSAALTALLTIYGITRRQVPGAWAFTVLVAAATLWSTADALALFSQDVATSVVLTRFKFLASGIIPWAWFAFAVYYTGRARRSDAVRMPLLGALPFGIALLPWLPGGQQFIAHAPALDTGGPLPILRVELTPLFWIYVAYSYALLAVGTTLLVGTLAHTWRLYHRQALVVLIGCLLPWAANVIYLLQLNPVPGLDPTPVAFSITGLLFAWGLHRGRLLDLVPLAHGAVFTGMADGVLVVDPHGRIVDLNPAAARLFGGDGGTIVGQAVSTVLGDATPSGTDTSIAGAGPREIVTGPPEARSYHEVRIVPLTRPDGGRAGELVMLQDVTAHRRTQRVLTYQAQHDPLTGLSNRTRFNERLNEAIDSARRDGTPVALLLIDLDDFKAVNDTFGHHAGDLLLQHAAAQVTALLGPGDTGARLGGDEFAVLLPAHDLGDAERMAARLRAALAVPLALDGHRLEVRASIGVAVGAGSDLDGRVLLRRADSTMYRAKRTAHEAQRRRIAPNHIPPEHDESIFPSAR